jgi:magnesium transporter
MLNLLHKGAKAPVQVEDLEGLALPSGVVWIDLLNPSRDEELAIEAALELCLPTREEMAEIETSSRLYRENRAAFMTAQVLSNTQGEAPQIGPCTFVLAGERLVTIRYQQPMAFKTVHEQVAREPSEFPNGQAVFLALLDQIVDRLADTVERTAGVGEELSERIFNNAGRTDYKAILRRLGRIQRLNGKIRESAASLTRLLIFCEATRLVKQADALESLQRDIASIVDYSGSLAHNTVYLLDAALGMINIEQNAIIKIFSIGAVIFLPPTLIASYFGMNFEHMAVFEWRYGEAAAFGGMVLSVAVALWLFRRKGWF